MIEKLFMAKRETFRMNIFDICYTSGTREYLEKMYKF